jgi:hypothetical protein
MRRKRIISMTGVLALGVTVVFAQNFSKLKATLTGQQELPIVSTVGNGTFSATISKDETQIDYELTYDGMESNVQQSHIHFGPKYSTGAIVVWLCSNLASPPTPVGVQACPLRSGTITGTISGSNIVGPASQGITSGEMAELVKAIREGNTYVNVHTAVSPAGEIRSQIGTDNNTKSHHAH